MWSAPGSTTTASRRPTDYAERLARLAARKLPFVCANPDLVIHRGDELVYCAGALGQAYEALGGEVIYAGKPYRADLRRGARRLRAGARPQPARRTLAIGDASAPTSPAPSAAGLDVLFVAGGIHRDEALAGERLDPERLAALFAREGFAPAATVARL